MRKGTGNRGGLFYQFLALFLSYLAVGLMTFAFIVEHVLGGGLNQPEQANVQPAEADKAQRPEVAEPKPGAVAALKPDAAKAGKDEGEAASKDVADAKTVEATKKAPPLAKKANGPAKQADAPNKLGLVCALFAFALFAGFVIAAGPVLMAVSDPISGLIYCFALFQAWKMNKPAVLALSGPFQVSQRVSEDPEHDDGE